VARLADAASVRKRSREHPWVAASAASLDRRDTYLALIGRLLAAIVASLLGAALILAGALGFARGTDLAPLAPTVGVLLLVLAVDQAWRVTRKLG
jgi:hypothetical protein